MKYSFINNKQLFFYILSAFFLNSCTSYNFSHPQPNDQENIYEFPDYFIGKWIEIDTATYDFEVEIPIDKNGGPSYNNNSNQLKHKRKEEPDYIISISKKNVLLVNGNKFLESKLIDGYWPKYSLEKGFIYPPNNMSSLNEVKYDSLNRPVDTISWYLLHNQRIYERESDSFLNRGYNYIKIKDTFSFHSIDSFYIDLGQNAFLRKISDSLYVLNINSFILGQENGSNWWQIYILEMKDKNTFYQWGSNSKTVELECMFYDHPKEDQIYFDCRWSTKELLNLLKNKYFDYSIFKKKE